MAEAVGAQLAPRGLLLIGLDVIGECITEINVTSPTCLPRKSSGQQVVMRSLVH